MLPNSSTIIHLTPELGSKLLELSDGILIHQYQNPLRGAFICQHCFISVRQGKVIGYAVIELNRFHRSECWFGPILLDRRNVSYFWTDFHRQLKAHGIWQLSLQPLTDQDSEIFQDLVKNLKFVYCLKQGWATAIKDISPPLDLLLKGYDPKHRYSIQRAKKLGITSRVISDVKEFESLIRIFLTMFDQRKIHHYPSQLASRLRGEFKYFQYSGNGLVIGSYKEETLLGGIVLIISGSTALYAYGAMNKNDKEPVMHAAIDHSFQLLKEIGITTFDFGGYFLGQDDEQFIALNRFKTRFSVTPVIYPSRLELNTSRFHAKFLKLLLSMRNRYLKFKNKHVS